MHTARVAILADSPLQRHVLQQVLADNGYHVVLNSDPERFDEAAWPSVATDLWLIDLSQTRNPAGGRAAGGGRSAHPVRRRPGAGALHRPLHPVGEAPDRKLKRLIGDPVAAVGPALETLLQDQPRPPRLTLPEPLANLPLPAGDPLRGLVAGGLPGPVRRR